MKPETTIGIAATAIALGGLGLSVWEGMETRHHNRLSVRPHLVITDNFVDGDPEYGVLVSNKGIGPAIVRELKLSVDGERVAPDEYGGWGGARSRLRIDQAWNHCSGFNGMAVSAGETVPLLAIKQIDQTDERRALLRKAIERLTIEIDYESMYGDQYTWPESRSR